MPVYKYKAIGSKSKIVRSKIQCAGLQEFYSIMSSEKLYCVDVKQKSEQSAFIPGTGSSLKPRHLSILCKQFASMLSAGIQIIQIIDMLYKQTSDKRLKTILLELYQANQKGMSLSEAMRSTQDVFPGFMLNMIEAGEMSGTLDEVMEKLSVHYEKEVALKNKLIQAMTYPIILLVVTMGIVVLIFTMVLPRIMNMLRGDAESMPAITRALLAMSNLLVNSWPLVLAIIAVATAISVLLYHYIPVRREIDRMKLKIPVIGKLNTIVMASRFSRTFCSLFSSGLPVVLSLELTGNTLTNYYVNGQLLKVIADISKGELLSISLQRLGVFPPLLITMLGVGEETGTLEGMLGKTSDYYDRESDAALQRLTSMIEPVMIVILAIVVGLIVISVMQPLYQMYSGMGTV